MMGTHVPDQGTAPKEKRAKQEKEEPTEQPDQGTAFKEKHAKQEQEEATEQSDGKGPAPVKMEANAKPEVSDVDFLNSLFGGMRGTEGVTPENFRALAYGLGKTILEKFNGPSNYLLVVAANDGGQEPGSELAKKLRNRYPARLNLPMIHKPEDLPGNDSDVFCLGLADLGYFPDLSTKPAPYLQTCLQLLDEILTNGFVSQGILDSINHMQFAGECLGLASLDCR